MSKHPTTREARLAWLAAEIRAMRRLHGLSRFEARDQARRKLFLMDVDAAKDVADLKRLLREIAVEVVWRT